MVSMRPALLSAFLLLLFGLRPVSVIAQAPRAGNDLAVQLSALEKELEDQRVKMHVPGCALVVVKNGQVVFCKGLGLRDVARNLPVTSDTLFAIGSSSKAFTATTVMMSVDEGKLTLNASPKRYLPYFKLQDPDADRRITLSDLLCHRSGLDRTDLLWAPGVLTSQEIIQAMAFVKPTAKLGERFQYQNVMFLTAGQCVAQVQHTPWQQFVARRIFQPLGMKATETSIEAMQRTPDYALGYNYDTAKKEFTHLPMRRLDGIAPAGAINSSATDMAHWLRFLLNGGVYGGKRLVSAANFALMMQPHMKMGLKSDYGYGWMLHDWQGHKVVEHGGNIDGFTAEVALIPDQHLGYALLTNENIATLGPASQEIVWKYLVPVAPAPADTATKSPAVDPAGEVGRYELMAAHLVITISLKGGKLQMDVPGQPAYTLENVGGRRYKLADPPMAGFFATFRPVKDHPDQAEVYLEQPQGNFALAKLTDTLPAIKPAWTAPLSVDELMAKVVAASGGEEALRRHHSMVAHLAMDLENQGVTAQAVAYSRAPDARTVRMTMRALGKTLVTARDYCDGAEAGRESSMASVAVKTGVELADTRLQSRFLDADLDWKSLYKTVTIERTEKVKGENVYVVKKTPAEGNPITDYVSTRTFLLLRRDSLTTVPSLDVTLPVNETYYDYRRVDGVMIPFKRVEESPLGGRTVTTVRDVQWDVPIADAIFKAK